MSDHPSRLVPSHEAERTIRLAEDVVREEVGKEPRLRSIIRGVQAEFGEDSDGRPAIWIRITVDAKTSTTQENVRLLNHLVTVTTTGLLQKDVPGWPYVTFIESPADPRDSSSRPT